MFKLLDKRNYEPYCHKILFQLSKDNETFLHRMSLLHSLDVHHGCVNSVVWDDAGELLLSGSDDQQLILSKPWLGNTSVKLHTAHRANIFSAKFIPYTSNQHIISCSGDGMLIFTDLERIPETLNCKFTCHIGTCYDVLTIGSDPHSFFSCGEDGTVRWFDLRVKTSCSMQDCKEDILLNMRRAVTAIAVNPLVHYQLAVSTQDSTTHIYDRRMLGTKAHDSFLTESNQAVLMRLKPECLEGKSHRVTSLRYSANGDMVLASYSSDYLYLFDIQNSKTVPLETMPGDHSLHDDDSSSGPTLKRLRLRGDWSDTGPQAVPESELRNQPEDVGQARPTLHSTLMQRMTDILSRMLPNPSTRASSRLRGLAERNHSVDLERSNPANDIFSPAEIVSDGVSNSSVPISHGDEELIRETSSAPASFASLSPSNITISSQLEVSHNSSDTPDINPPVFNNLSSWVPISIPVSDGISFDTAPIVHSPPQQSFPNISSSESNVPLETSIQERNTLFIANDSPSLYADNESNDLSNDYPLENINRAISLASDAEDPINVNPPLAGDQLSSNVINSGAAFPSCTLSSDIACFSNTSPCNQTNVTYPNIIAFNNCNDSYTSEACQLTLDTSSSSTNDIPSVMENNTNETGALSGKSAIKESEQDTASSLLNDSGPSTSMQTSPLTVSQSPSNRKSPKRRVRTQDDATEVNTPERRRINTSSRLVQAIERVRQQRRDENKPSSREEAIKRTEGDGYDKHIAYGVELMQYKGHRNARTMIKEACFWGDSHVMSGSDCGRVFVWNKNSGRLVMLWEADRHVVNCLQPHPTLPILATSGIDYDIKLWAPLCDDPKFDEENAIEIARRNEMLLAETRDTVTVPATFMIRMLASLNQLRRDRLRNRNRNQNDDDNEEENDDDDDDD